MDDLDYGATLRGFSAGQKVFKRYTLQKILGRGGMGVVWLARDEELEREVALKFLPEVVAMDRQAVQDLKRETRRSLELTHPHIIRIYDFVQDGGAAAISMEYVAGDTLAGRKLDQPAGHFEPGEIAGWTRELCEAMQYAHERAQVVHRDLKPANLMIDARGELKIADFGIAASVSDSVSRVSVQASSSGTPVYMSPQQMMGEKPAVSDDIYSLGATLYDLLTSRPPFHGGNIIAQVQGKVPVSLAARREDLGLGGEPIPPAWEETIAACLAKEPGDRPGSAREVAERLGLVAAVSPPRTSNLQRPTSNAQGRTAKFESGELAASAPPVAVQSRIRNPKSKIPLILVLAVVLAAGALAATYWGWYVPHRERQTAEAAVVASRAQLSHQVSALEAALQRQDWADAERRLAAWDDAARTAPVDVVPEWTRAEMHWRGELAEQREKARLAALRVPVRLDSSPTEAEVWVAGERRGLTPLNGLALPLGPYEVILRKAGFEERVEQVNVTEGSTGWQWELERSRGRLAMTGRPDGLWYAIYLDADENGQVRGDPHYRGRLPEAEPLALPTGRHRVLFEREGLAETLNQSQVIQIERGQRLAIAADLRGGVIRVESDPPGAEVYLDGKLQDEPTPWEKRDVPMGQTHELTLQLPDHKPAQQRLEVTSYDDAVVWAPQLEYKPAWRLRPDFSQGPRRLAVEMKAQARMNQSVTVSGKPQKPTESNTESNQRSTVHLSAPDAQGFWTRARADLDLRENFHDGTQVAFSREATHWAARFERGGFNFAGGENMANTMHPSYPGMWLDDEILPDLEAEIDRSWSVPVTKARLLVTGSHIPNPTGTIRGRVASVGGEPGGRWTEVVYDYDFHGTMVLPTGTAEMRASGHYKGSVTVRLLVDEAYVTNGRLDNHLTMDLVNPINQAAGNVEVRTVTHAVMEVTARPVAAARETAAAGTAGDTATVVFFRDGQMQGGMQAVRVQVGGRELASLRRNRYHVVTLPAGTHVFKPIITGVPSTEYPRALEGGTTYYVRCFPDYGMVKVTAGMEFMDQGEGTGRVRGLQPTEGSLPLPPF